MICLITKILKERNRENHLSSSLSLKDGRTFGIIDRFDTKNDSFIIGWLIMFIGFSCASNLVDLLIAEHYILRQVFAPRIAPIQMSASIALTLTLIGMYK